jgi:hypothetical protein
MPTARKKPVKISPATPPSAPFKVATTANDRQVGGGHYKVLSIQPWDFIAANKLGYFEGNVVKYVSRHQDKGGLQDLHKARHYLDKLIELEEDKLAEASAFIRTAP